MKAIIISIAIFSATFFNYSFASGNTDMNKVLEKGITFKNGELPINSENIEFVRVSFKINHESSRIEIIQSNSSNESIKKQLLFKLTDLNLVGSFDMEKVYHYNFTFEKK